MGEIYKLTCEITQKSYIGQALNYIGKNKQKHGSIGRWKSHIIEANGKRNKGCILLNNAIRKYGELSFTLEVLLRCEIDMLNFYETKMILGYDTLEPNGYNIRTGGSKGTHSKESRERMRQSKLGPKNHNYGKPKSDEIKEKLRRAKSGENHHFYGKQFTITHKLALSKSHKKYDKSLPMYVTYVKARPQCYQSEGYAVTNHPNGKNKQFTSKKYSKKEKLQFALEYLEELECSSTTKR